MGLLCGVYSELDSSVAEFTLSQRFFAAPSLHSGLRFTRMTEGEGFVMTIKRRACNGR